MVGQVRTEDRSCPDASQFAEGLVVQRHVLGGEVFQQVTSGAGAGDQQHVGCQLEQPLQCDLRRGDAKAGGRLDDRRDW